MGSGRATRGLCLAALAALWLGCATPQPRIALAPALPAARSVVVDQLVLHSDFELPASHRLLEELRALRQDVLQQTGLEPSAEPVHVYLFDGADEYETFIHARYPSFPDRRAFFVETDTRLLVYAHWGDRVAEDLRHEVTHGYLHAVVPRIPLWLDEGLAEYFESPPGHAGLNRRNLEVLLQRTAQEGWRPNLDRLETLTSPAEMTPADYAEAWAWAHVLLKSPDGRQALRGYLQRVKSEQPAPQFAPTLRDLWPQAEGLLVAHLQELAPQVAAASDAP